MVKIFFVWRDGQAPYIVKYLNNKVYMFDKEWATTSIMETRNKHSNKSLSKTNICTMLLKITSKNIHNVVIWVIKLLEIFEKQNLWHNNFLNEHSYNWGWFWFFFRRFQIGFGKLVIRKINKKLFIFHKVIFIPKNICKSSTNLLPRKWKKLWRTLHECKCSSI